MPTNEPLMVENEIEEEESSLRALIKKIGKLRFLVEEEPISREEIEREKRRIRDEKAEAPEIGQAKPDFDITKYTLKPFRVTVFAPKTMEDCKEVVDILREEGFAVVNFEDLENARAIPFFNFICGACYTLSGKSEKVSNEVYAFSCGKGEVIR